MTNPIELLRQFAEFAGLGVDAVRPFLEQARPDLIEPSSPEAPPPSPDDLIDESVRDAIERREL